MTDYFEGIGLEDYFEGIDNIKRTYFKVCKKFPLIKKGEVKLRFNPEVKLAGLWIEEVLTNPLLDFGILLFKRSDEEKEAIIAHELGHYICITEHYKTPKMIERMLRWMNILNNHEFKTFWGGYSVESPKIRRIKDWTLIHEIYADNQAVKAGYGEKLLATLKTDLIIYNLSERGRKGF